MHDKIEAEAPITERATNNERVLGFAAQIVAAYVGHNTLATDAIPALIGTVYQSLVKVGSGLGGGLEARPEPAVHPKKSITDNYIICLEDGKQLKMLKRHLKTAYNLTPDQYRERWGLGGDYPMVAPNYAKQRSRLAKQIGLGTARRIVKQKDE